MTLIRRSLVACTLILACTVSPVGAQFQYFGQNKITYERFEWKTYESPHFDIYYYETEEQFLEDIVSFAESAYLKLSKEFDHEIRWRIPMIVYKTHAEFEQTNIQMSEIPESTLAFAEPIQNRMVFPIDSPPDFLYALITHELTHIFEFSFFFEGSIGRIVRSSPPLWLMEGLASFMADDESSIDKMVIRDAVVNNVLPPIEALDFNPFFSYRFGHAVFDYIEQEHGKEGLRNFIFEYRKHLLTGNLTKAVEDTFGYDIGEFNRRFNRYLRLKYFPVLLEKKSPDEYGRRIGPRKYRDAFTFSPTLSPSGELVAALSAPKLELDLVVLHAEDGSLVKNVTKGWTNKYRYLIAEAFSGKNDVSWSPTNDHVAVFARKENKRILLIHDAVKGKIVKKIKLGDIVESSSPAYSPDGRKIAFEGNRGGVVDIFEYDLETGDIVNLTQDDQYDTNPRYSSDGTTLLYNRRIGPYWKVFSVDRTDPSRKTQITFGPSSDVQPSYSKDGKTIYFSSDRNDNKIYNIYALNLESGTIEQHTDVTGGCFSPVELGERGDEQQLLFTAYYQGAFSLYRMPLKEPEATIEAAEIGGAPVEPFEPPLQLTVDETKKTEYRQRWDLETPNVTVGLTNDGTFLTNSYLQFSDLLGNQRVQIFVQTISTFSNLRVTYLNYKRRTNWGASIFDYRDYFVDTAVVNSGNRDQTQRTTGGNFFVEYPFNRHYRVQGSVGLIDRSQDFLIQNNVPGTPTFGGLFVETVKQTFLTLDMAFVGDTTRYQEWGAFQGKRFNIGVLFAPNIGGDIEGDVLQYNMDFRAYKQLTRRSTLAWRLSGIYGDGDENVANAYSLGGLNQLRGYDFREFFGTRVAWSNLELRFPLVDQFTTPIIGLRGIRGFFFLDVGAAWFISDDWYDPDLRTFRIDPQTGDPIPFSAWDSENDRFQDARASYGMGLSFFFLGGLQFNFAWANRLPYTHYILDPVTCPGSACELVPVEGGDTGLQSEFYIIYDW
jgi:hypothetical protein